MFTRTERHIIVNSPQIDHGCFLAKNLYNHALYVVRQELIHNKRWIRYRELDKLMQPTPDYRILPASTAQQILILLDKNFKGFFAAIKAYKKNPENFTGRPKLPKYKHKVKGRSVLIFTKKQARLKDGYIKFPKKLGIPPIETKVNRLNQVRIIPQATCYVIEVVYEKEIETVIRDEDRVLSVDLGLDNAATCVNNIGEQPFIINGGPLKSINQYYNKFKAEFQSKLPKNQKTSNRINRLTFKRNNKVRDYMHKATRFIIDYCVKYDLGTIIVGYNEQWKTGINLGDRNNQNFVNIPFSTFINQLKYKGEESGIKVIGTEESYTSKCSFLDNEPVQKQEVYQGKRIERGLFRSKNGTLINADVNGAYNIMRKVIPNAYADGIEGVALHPLKINTKFLIV